MANHATGFTAHEFGYIGVFLLRHDGRAGAEAVGNVDKAETRAHPQNQFFGKTAQVNHNQRSGSRELNGKIAVRYGIERVLADLFKAQQLGGNFALNRVGGTGKGCGAERHTVDAFAAVGHALEIAAEHFDVGEHVMPEADRLGNLQMGETGHDGCGVLFCQINQGRLKVLNQALNNGNLIAQPQADVGSDLVVAAAAGVQAFAGIADFVGEAAFDVHVDIFQIQRPGNRSLFDFCYNLGHALTDGGEVVFAQNARLCQHLRVCQRALDVPFCQSFVKINRAGIFFDQLGNRFVKTA